MSKKKLRRIPTKDIRKENGSGNLSALVDMKPYMRYTVAAMQGANVKFHLKTIAKLPLEQRYVWRVTSAFELGLSDFDDFPVDADRETLTPEDFAKVLDLLTVRPIQFCMFLKRLVGTEEMKRVMMEAVLVASQEA
jgi:hypothetical protein